MVSPTTTSLPSTPAAALFQDELSWFRHSNLHKFRWVCSDLPSTVCRAASAKPVRAATSPKRYGQRGRLNRGRICRVYLAGLCVRRAAHDELGGSNGHDRSAQKAATLMVDFFGHSSLSTWINLLSCQRRRHKRCWQSSTPSTRGARGGVCRAEPLIMPSRVVALTGTVRRCAKREPASPPG
jgi:hypothetical protein